MSLIQKSFRICNSLAEDTKDKSKFEDTHSLHNPWNMQTFIPLQKECTINLSYDLNEEKHTHSLSLSLSHTHTHTHTHTTHTLNAHVAHVLGMLKTQWSKLSLQVTSGWLCVVLVFRDHPKSAQNGFHFLFFFSILVSNSIDLLGLPTKAKDIFRV